MAALVVMFSGCIKNDKACTPKSPESEAGQITTYMSANGITGVKHASGIYYQIIDAGTGATPAPTSVLTVNYTGKFLNGTTFDQTTTSPAQFPLNGVIEGWQIGLPLIKKGGKIRLLIPSAYGYGCNDYQSIPGNSVLDFYIELLDVK